MKTFEIHITGKNGEIIDELNNFGIKNITIELLRKNGSVLRTEYMSSFIIQEMDFVDCMYVVVNLLSKIKTNVLRVKIETPYYEEYVDKSLYMEAHFDSMVGLTKYPISRNVKSGKIMATDREYDKMKYSMFQKDMLGHDIELCIFDTFVDEDMDWFELYKN